MKPSDLESNTQVPTSFWRFLEQFASTEQKFAQALQQLDRKTLELHFLVYTQLRADLADHFHECGYGFTEDHAEDVADGVVTSGLGYYCELFRSPTKQELNESCLNASGRYHLFFEAYEGRFNGELVEVLDRLESGDLPWISSSQ